MEEIEFDLTLSIEPLDEKQKLILDLANGSRKPQNKDEEILLRQIKAIEKKGHMLDLSFE
ncbi:hypothetical protein [Lutibacter sp.]